MIFLLVLAIIAFGYIFLICPGPGRHKPDIFAARPIAHRGIHDSPDVDENSLTAFRLAAERGFGIELDVRLTSDGVPVVMHDESLKRMCRIDSAVSDISSSKIKECRFSVSGERVPSLADVLALVAGRAPLLIELKGNGKDEIAEKTAELMADYSGPYAIESFVPLYIRRYRKASPDANLGILADRVRGGGGVGERIIRRMASSLLFNFIARPDFIAYRYSDGIGINLRLCRALGARTAAWTLRESAEFDRAADLYDWMIGENIESWEWGAV